MALAPPVVRIPVAALRARFNEGRYYERMRAGDLTSVLLSEGHPAPGKSEQPFCTRSQVVQYLDDDRIEIARVHQYLRPDGTLGASGRPDPKRIFEAGVIYAAKS